ERLVGGILGIAGCERAMEYTLKYMHERSAFGKPIAKYQVLRHRMAELATEIEITKRFVYYCCDLFQRGIFAVKECSMAKMKATELGKTVADECLQMFGGYGYMAEYPIERAYRDARVGTIVGGTTEIMKEIISKVVIDGVSYESAYKNMKASGQDTAKVAKPKPAVADSTTNSDNISSLNTNGKMASTPQTAKEIIYSLPQRLKTDKIDESASSVFHFKLNGPNGGEFTAVLKDKAVTVSDGLTGDATCVITAKDSDYEDLELGRGNPQMMLMMGKIKVSNLSEIMKFATYFSRLG
ncbi:MAG TPA: acyl-CoA dehydrogenase family protein, partial [Chitinophagales bacterium]|nr:acyl-CoA dehydrogenase family protein [Chitinophagales bacterium]